MLIVIALFNDLRQPAVIWATVPLALIGITLGLLLTRQPFGFMALLGAMSLSGMMVKNAIVLIDEIELQKKQGSEPLKAIIDSGVSRLRPVAMAALTTALGMLPLLQDAFFIAMAVTIIGSAAEISGHQRPDIINSYVEKHPYLEDFAKSPTFAVVKIKIKSYFLVKNFQNVMELHLHE